jgi:hypothetical protein
LLGEKYDIGKFILAIGAQQQSVDVINLPSITTAVSDKRIQSSLSADILDSVPICMQKSNIIITPYLE